LIVGESHPPGAELLPQHAVLSLEIVDDIELLLVDPAGQGDEEKTQGEDTGGMARAGYQTRWRDARE
jgi:hypothetical protein